MLQSIRTKTKALLMAGLMVLAMFTTATATELHDAARDGDIAKIERLLDAGANPNARVESGFTALQIAALSGHADAITALLDAGADTNARVEKNITPLHAAAILGHADAIIALLNGGANINARDKKESATPPRSRSKAHHSTMPARSLLRDALRADHSSRRRLKSLLCLGLHPPLEVIRDARQQRDLRVLPLRTSRERVPVEGATLRHAGAVALEPSAR